MFVGGLCADCTDFYGDLSVVPETVTGCDCLEVGPGEKCVYGGVSAEVAPD